MIARMSRTASGVSVGATSSRRSRRVGDAMSLAMRDRGGVVNFLAATCGIQAEVEVEENVDRKGTGTVVPNGANSTTSPNSYSSQ